MRSHFSAQTLAEVFRDLYLRERSGMLILTREEHEKHVFFHRGMIFHAESPLDEEDLGCFLVNHGLLSEGALEEAEASVNGAPSTQDLAQALVRRDLVGKTTLLRAVREIVDNVVQSVFRWEGGSARFSEGHQPVAVFETDILITFTVILQGVLNMAGFAPIHEAMQGLENRLRVRLPTPIPLERLTLSPSHGFILSRVDGATNLRDLISILPPGEEEVAARFVFGLLVMGVLEYDPAVGNGPFKVADILRDHADRQALEELQEQTIVQAYEQIREQHPHEILGVSHTAIHDEIEKAYEQTKAQFSRDRILPNVREKFRAELAVIESRLIEAFLTLTQPDRPEPGRSEAENEAAKARAPVEVDDLLVRVEMDKAKSKLAQEQAARVADSYYAKGRKYMREGDFHNAIQYCKLAISYNQSDARYYFMLGECQERNPDARWQRLAEENFVKATQLDPWNAEYWISLGRFYRKRGLKLRARKKFEEALKLMPSSTEILRELESLD